LKNGTYKTNERCSQSQASSSDMTHFFSYP
jgi:hypothetical protein